MSPPRDIRRWPDSLPGRSRATAAGGMVWVAATASAAGSPVEHQIAEVLSQLDAGLLEAGSARHRVLSLQVQLGDADDRETFDAAWREWIGPDPAAWPHRVVTPSLAPGEPLQVSAVALQFPERGAPH